MVGLKMYFNLYPVTLFKIYYYKKNSIAKFCFENTDGAQRILESPMKHGNARDMRDLNRYHAVRGLPII